MGMDLYGHAPTAEVGTYFRRNVWGWHPLWELVEDLVPELSVHVASGHTNDGDGLDGELSKMLADRLRELLSNETIAAYVTARNKYIADLPLEKCEYCNGTGVRTDEVGQRMGMPERNYCNGCASDEGITPGYRRPESAMYYLEKDDVEEFAAFLEASGGFVIY